MHLIQNYIHNLMENLPKKEEPENINLILDGGAFNGSYLIGALYFLKEMEKQQHLTIHKISCCSIGSVCALIYHINALDLIPELYNIILNQFKEHRNLGAFDTCIARMKLRIAEDKIDTTDLCEKLNNRIYISYYNISKGKKIVKSKYRNIDELFETIYKSCFVPFIVNGDIVYKNRFCDGMTPYIFPWESGKKILYLDLFGTDKVCYVLSVKNEKTNFHRILAGLLDVHLFYIKQCNSTQMCSYINKWSLLQLFYYKIVKMCAEKTFFYTVYFIFYLKQVVPDEIYENIIFKILTKIIKSAYIALVDYYCL